MPSEDKWYISGALAIGTPEPTGQLTVEGIVQPNQGRLTFFSANADVEYDGGKDGIFVFRNTAQNGKTAFVGGNVGIGTANPSAGLEIDKGPTNDVALVLNSSGPGWGSGLQLKNTAQGGKTYGIYSGFGSLHITDADNGVDRLLIDGSGNVGIGTTSPGGRLEVAGGGGASIDLIVNGRLKSNNNDGGLWVAGDRFIGGHSTDKVGIWNGNDWQLTVQSDGKVGIGTEEPKAQLDVSGRGSIALGGKQAIYGDDSWLRLNQDGAFTSGVHTPKLFFPGSLNVGGRQGGKDPEWGNAWFSGSIAYDGQLNKLHVGEGDGHARIRAHDLWLGHSGRGNKKSGDSIGRALVDSDDELIEVGVPARPSQKHLKTLVINYDRDWEAVLIHGHVNTPSSRKLKDNIEALSSDMAQTIVSALEPVTYFYKNDELRLQTLGFVAEDAPTEVVSPNRESITFNHIVAALTRVVKDQAQSISNLKAQIELLTNMAAAMKTS